MIQRPAFNNAIKSIHVLLNILCDTDRLCLLFPITVFTKFRYDFLNVFEKSLHQGSIYLIKNTAKVIL